MSLFITVAPLMFGLAAWVLGGLCLAAKEKARRLLLSAISWALCACALWFPLYSILEWVEKGDTSAIMDCTYAFCFCAGVLLAVNLALQLAAALLHRKSSV